MKLTKLGQHLQNVKKLEQLDEQELTRALRDAIIAEEGAINQYETVADSTNNADVKEILQDIANEEKIHVGELQKLLSSLLPDEQDFLDEGAGEVKKQAGTVKKVAQNSGQPNPNPNQFGATVQSGPLSQQQVVTVLKQLDQKFPGIMDLWNSPGSGRQAIMGLLNILANVMAGGIDTGSVQFLKTKLNMLNK